MSDAVIVQYDTRYTSSDFDKKLHPPTCNYNNKDLLIPLMKINRAYARLHGYTYIFKNTWKTMPPYWAKVKVICKIMEESKCKYVMWLDTDACINQTGRTIQDFWDSNIGRGNKNAFMMFTSDPPIWESYFLAGVFIIRNCSRARMFMRNWLQMYKSVKDTWTYGRTGWRCSGEWARSCYEQGACAALLRMPRWSKYSIRLPYFYLQNFHPLITSGKSFSCHFPVWFKSMIPEYLRLISSSAPERELDTDMVISTIFNACEKKTLDTSAETKEPVFPLLRKSGNTTITHKTTIQGKCTSDTSRVIFSMYDSMSEEYESSVERKHWNISDEDDREEKRMEAPPYHAITKRNIGYCITNGYQFVCPPPGVPPGENGHTNPDRFIIRHIRELLRKHIDTHDYIVWLGRAAIIHEVNTSIHEIFTTYVKTKGIFGLCFKESGYMQSMGGTITSLRFTIVKVCKESLDFFEKAVHTTDRTPSQILNDEKRFSIAPIPSRYTGEFCGWYPLLPLYLEAYDVIFPESARQSVFNSLSDIIPCSIVDTVLLYISR